MKTIKIAVCGVITCVIYFFSILIFLITKTELSLTVWEAVTVLGAVVSAVLLTELGEMLQISAFYRSLLQIFLTCTCALTGVAHVINVLVTRRLMSEGVEVPTYFQIGYWPSAEMAVDYLAWGFFMGLAFLTVGAAAQNTEKRKCHIKETVLVCGVLCLIGFFGATFVHENIWYFAPLGYGCGLIVICCQMIKENWK